MNSLAVELLEKDKVLLVEKETGDPKPGEVQVRSAYSLISPGTERALIKQLQNVTIRYPRSLGYSLSGVIEKVGDHVVGFKEGDWVACHAPHQSLVNVETDKCILIPDQVSLQEAAFISLGNISLQGVRKAAIELGESVMVLGLGLVGQVTLQMAALCGGMPVIGVDRSDTRLDMALKNKADIVLNTNDDSWIEKLQSVTSGKGASTVIESTGFPDPINLALKAAAIFGKVILLGSTRAMTEVNFYSDVHGKGLKIIGAHVGTVPQHESHSGYWTFRDNYKCFMELLKYKKINMTNLVTDVVESEDVLSLYNRITEWDDSVVAALIKW